MRCVKIISRRMYLPKILKFCLLAALFAPACRFWQPKTDAPDAPPKPTVVEEIKSAIPFATKEPEVYQTEIRVTGGGIENVMFTARNSAKRLTVYDYEQKSEFALLQTGDGASFLIARQSKIYAVSQTGNAAETADVFPTAELLNEKSTAVFELLGAENGFAKYRVRLDESSRSEIIVTVDEKLNLPVKQEFYSVAGERETLVSTTEFKNFNLQTDARNFDLPKDYKKVSPTEFQVIRRREREK